MSAEAYRRVVPTFWSDPDVKRPLSRDQKLLALYFFTSPHSNMIGLYYCPLAYVSAETDLPIEDIRRALVGPLSKFVTYDEETEEVFVFGLAKHNIGDELKVGTDKHGNEKPDHRIAGVRKLVLAAHSKRLVRAFLLRYGTDYQLGMPLPDERETPSKPLASPLEGVPSDPGSPFEAKAVAVAVAGAQHNTANQQYSDTSYPSSARSEEPANEPAMATMGDVLGLVVEHLYFGKRPAAADMTVNASVLKALNSKHRRPWPEIGRAVIGLAERRNKGELEPTVKRNEPVSCKWLYSKKPVINQVAASEDAFYRDGGSDPPSPDRRGGSTAIGDMDFSKFARRQSDQKGAA